MFRNLLLTNLSGFQPLPCFSPGRVAIVAKSGTLSYEGTSVSLLIRILEADVSKLQRRLQEPGWDRAYASGLAGISSLGLAFVKL